MSTTESQKNAGVFVSFEGGEACGKSTQVQLLLEAVRGAFPGREVQTLREPGGTAIGEVLRNLLKFHPDAKDMVKETELLLFAASRAQLVREKVVPLVEGGGFVIADRFVDSTIAYQGGGRGLDVAFLRQVNEFSAGPAMPQVTFLLDMPVGDAFKRLRARAPEGSVPDRMESEQIDFYERVREAYLDEAAASMHHAARAWHGPFRRAAVPSGETSQRIVLLDASRPVADLHQEILGVLQWRGLWSWSAEGR